MLNSFKFRGLVLVSVLLMFGGGLSSTSNFSLYAGTKSVQVEQDVLTCKGIVVDNENQPIIGASILIKGTYKGTQSDIDGKFVLNQLNKGTTLEISCIGYETVDVIWNGNQLKVTLKEDTKFLDEVVIVGYGVQKKVNVTGAVSTMDAKSIEARPVSNVSQVLQGAIPGLNLTVTSMGGALGSPLSMNIRGAGTIGDGSTAAPLVLIDGIEGDINTLNPNDIESVSVLKDAASSAIYGTRAAFGVILVTTKSGRDGGVRVNYSGDIRFNTATQLPSMASSLEFAKAFNAASINGSGGAVFDDAALERITNFIEGKYTDPSKPEYYGTMLPEKGIMWNMYAGSFANTNWFKEMYKPNVPSTSHNISVSGGNQKINYMVSLGFLANKGVLRHGNDELKRFNLNSKIGAQLASWAHLDYFVKWSRQNHVRPQWFSWWGGEFFHNIARRWPTNPYKDPNGHWNEHSEIEELIHGGDKEDINDTYTQQLKLTITPLEGWNIYAEGALKTYNNRATTARIPVTVYDIYNKPHIRNSDYGTVSTYSDRRFRQDYYAVNIFSDYTRSFDLHNFKGLVGVNYERYNQDTLWGSGKDLTTNEKPYLSQTQENKDASDSYWNRATAGWFGRLNYNYDEKYLFEYNLRYDGSSRFTSENRWDFFHSLSAGWNIAREDFFKSLTDKVSTLKLRTSWGQLGNTSSNYSGFSDWYPFYQQQSLAAQNSGWLIDGKKQNTASLPGIVNTEMTWETVETWDLGLDVVAFNNKLSATFDVFSRTTKDMIGPAPVLGSVLGVDAPKTNNCKMRTRGWELEVSWRDQINDFNYGVKFNISDNQSKILSYPFDGNFDNQSIWDYYNGKKLGEIWGFESIGLAKTDQQMTEWLEANKPTWGDSWGAGDVMYKNIADTYDEDGKLIDENEVNAAAQTLGSHGDLKRIGNTSPRYRFGLNLDASWKGFDFSMFLQGVLKRDWMAGGDDPYFWGISGNMWQCAVFTEHTDYWTPKNTGAYYPKPYFNTGKNRQPQTRYLQDASYIRCKNIQLGYTLPENVTSVIGLNRCRFYLSIDNLFTITKMSKVYDPEVIDGLWGSGKTYPLQRTIALGASLTF